MNKRINWKRFGPTVAGVAVATGLAIGAYHGARADEPAAHAHGAISQITRSVSKGTGSVEGQMLQQAQEQSEQKQEKLDQELKGLPFEISDPASNAQWEQAKLDFESAAQYYAVAAGNAQIMGKMDVAAYYAAKSVSTLEIPARDYMNSEPQISIKYFDMAAGMALGYYKAGYGPEFLGYAIDNLNRLEQAYIKNAENVDPSYKVAGLTISVGNQSEARQDREQAAKVRQEVSALGKEALSQSKRN